MSEDEEQELPPEGKLEVARRRNAAVAVIGEYASIAPVLVPLEQRLKVNNSRVEGWKVPALYVVSVLGFALGDRAWSGFYGLAFIAAAVVVGWALERQSLQSKKDAYQMRLRAVRSSWISAGHSALAFEVLEALARRNDGQGLEDRDDEYAKWWYSMNEDSENAVREMYGLEPVTGAYERHLQFQESLDEFREKHAVREAESPLAGAGNE